MAMPAHAAQISARQGIVHGPKGVAGHAMVRQSREHTFSLSVTISQGLKPGDYVASVKMVSKGVRAENSNVCTIHVDEGYTAGFCNGDVGTGIDGNWGTTTVSIKQTIAGSNGHTKTRLIAKGAMR